MKTAYLIATATLPSSVLSAVLLYGKGAMEVLTNDDLVYPGGGRTVYPAGQTPPANSGLNEPFVVENSQVWPSELWNGKRLVVLPYNSRFAHTFYNSTTNSYETKPVL